MLDKAQGIDVTSKNYWNNNWLSEIKIDGYDFSATNVVNKETDKMIFNIGDRVEVIKPDHKYYGRIGIVDDIIDICGHCIISVKFCGYCTPWVTESFEPDDIFPVSIRDGFKKVCMEGKWDSKENFWKYWKRDEQVVKDTIKNLMEENNMSKFRIGDTVIVKNNVKAIGKYPYPVGNPGDIGIVKRIEYNVAFSGNDSYYIEFIGRIGEYKMAENDLDLYNNPRSVGLPRSSGRYPWSDSNNIPKIKKVIFNCPATIVIFEDGTKSVVKIDKDDTVWDPEHGLAMALVKRVYGTNKSHSNYYDIFKKWLPNKAKGEMFQYLTEGSLVQVNNPCVDCPDRKNGCLTNCKKMQDYADECYNKTKKIEEERVKEIEEKFGEKVRAMREKNKPEEVKKGFIGDFYFKKDYMAQMSPIEFLNFCRENQLMFYLENCETAIDPDTCSWQQIFSYLKKGKLSATTKIKYVCNAQFRGDKLIDAVDVNYVVFSKKQ